MKNAFVPGWLPAHGPLVSLKDGFSLDSPAGRLHARILASVAEYETEVRAIVNCCVLRNDQAASCRMRFRNFFPWSRWTICSWPLSRRQRASAD